MTVPLYNPIRVYHPTFCHATYHGDLWGVYNPIAPDKTRIIAFIFREKCALRPMVRQTTNPCSNVDTSAKYSIESRKHEAFAD